MTTLCEQQSQQHHGDRNGACDAATAMFRADWQVYRSVLAGDHLEHACLYASALQLLSRLRRERARPLRLVDLGCGDAEYVCRSFRQLAASEANDQQPLLQAYTGVDLTPPALALAKERLAQSVHPSTTCSLVLDDIESWLHKQVQAPQQQPCDVIVTSFALHHLEPDAKLRVLELARQLLSGSDGMLILIDVFRSSDESLDAFRDRFIPDVENCWSLDVHGKEAVKAHVCEFDIPESLETYRDLSRQAQFSEMEVVTEGGKGFSKLVVFRV